jgi:hypothetical protein
VLLADRGLRTLLLSRPRPTSALGSRTDQRLKRGPLSRVSGASSAYRLSGFVLLRRWISLRTHQRLLITQPLPDRLNGHPCLEHCDDEIAVRRDLRPRCLPQPSIHQRREPRPHHVGPVGRQIDPPTRRQPRLHRRSHVLTHRFTVHPKAFAISLSDRPACQCTKSRSHPPRGTFSSPILAPITSLDESNLGPARTTPTATRPAPHSELRERRHRHHRQRPVIR